MQLNFPCLDIYWYEEVVDKLSWNSAAISHLQINTSDIEFQLTGYPIISGLFSVCRFSA